MTVKAMKKQKLTTKFLKLRKTEEGNIIIGLAADTRLLGKTARL